MKTAKGEVGKLRLVLRLSSSGDGSPVSSTTASPVSSPGPSLKGGERKKKKNKKKSKNKSKGSGGGGGASSGGATKRKRKHDGDGDGSSSGSGGSEKKKKISAAAAAAKRKAAALAQIDRDGIRAQLLQEALVKLDEQVSERDKGMWFQAPVTEDIAPGYSSVVSRPMDMGTMRERVQAGGYASIDEWETDMCLVCDNCVTYNGAETPIAKEAARLKVFATKNCAKMRPRYTRDVEKSIKAAENAMLDRFKKSEKALAPATGGGGGRDGSGGGGGGGLGDRPSAKRSKGSFGPSPLSQSEAARNREMQRDQDCKWLYRLRSASRSARARLINRDSNATMGTIDLSGETPFFYVLASATKDKGTVKRMAPLCGTFSGAFEPEQDRTRTEELLTGELRRFLAPRYIAPEPPLGPAADDAEALHRTYGDEETLAYVRSLEAFVTPDDTSNEVHEGA
eukprot:UC1_evm2s1735